MYSINSLDLKLYWSRVLHSAKNKEWPRQNVSPARASGRFIVEDSWSLLTPHPHSMFGVVRNTEVDTNDMLAPGFVGGRVCRHLRHRVEYNP